MSKAISVILMVVMPVLLGTYLYLNSYKVDVLKAQFHDYAAGQAALEVDIRLNGETLVSRPLRSSDLFDAQGTHQMSFMQLEAPQLQRLKSAHEAVELLVNGRPVKFSLNDQGKAMQLIWDDRKLVLVPQGDLETIASKIWADSARRQNIIQCDGESFCRNVQVAGFNWGALEGPYLESDYDVSRRGMPRGRWMPGPATKIIVNANVPTKAILKFELYALFPDQQIKMMGPSLVAMKMMKGKIQHKAVGERTMYPRSVMAKVDLHEGKNEFLIQFSLWRKANVKDNRPLAAYLTGIRLKEDTVADNGG